MKFYNRGLCNRFKSKWTHESCRVVVRVVIRIGNRREKLAPLLFHDYLSGIARGSLCDVYMADLSRGGVPRIKTREDS